VGGSCVGVDADADAGAGAGKAEIGKTKVWFGITGRRCVAATPRACRCAVVVAWTAPQSIVAGFVRAAALEGGFGREVSFVAIWDWAVRTASSGWIEGGGVSDLRVWMRARRRARTCSSLIVGVSLEESCSLVVPLLEVWM
jgi:hypothetical protein